jgi:hypothetical protein
MTLGWLPLPNLIIGVPFPEACIISDISGVLLILSIKSVLLVISPPVELSIIDILYTGEASASDLFIKGVVGDSVDLDIIKLPSKKIPETKRTNTIPAKNPFLITTRFGPVFVLFLESKDGLFLLEKTIPPIKC